MHFEPTQLALDINLASNPSFSNFIPGKNAALLAQLERLASPEVLGFSSIYVWGPEASGKTHLLQALAFAALENSLSHSYVNLSQEFNPKILQDLDSEIICIDNLDAIAGQGLWEEQLFHLFNRQRDLSKRLVFAAQNNLANLGLGLPDLESRLAWGLSYQTHSLSDEDKLLALQVSAQQRGLHLPSEVGNYLLTRGPRKLSDLFILLDTLDAASLKEQRKLTLPFVRRILNW